jgi:hypothetical protein
VHILGRGHQLSGAKAQLDPDHAPSCSCLGGPDPARSRGILRGSAGVIQVQVQVQCGHPVDVRVTGPDEPVRERGGGAAGGCVVRTIQGSDALSHQLRW